MNDCPTCAYRTTCNQRYRGQDCKYWKGGDDERHTADRGGKREGIANGKAIMDLNPFDCGQDDCSVCPQHRDEAVDILLAYRADAVKAERERDIAGEVWDILVPHIRPVDKHRSVTSVYDEMREHFPIPAILSYDQEAHNG